MHLIDLFKTRCAIPKALLRNVPLFYQDLCNFWHEFCQKNKVKSVSCEYLWFNPHIIVDKQSLFYKKWYDKGIRKISDIINANGQLLFDHELKTKYDIDFHFLEYLSLRQAIPYSWKQSLIEGQMLPEIEVDYPTNMACKNIYWYLHRETSNASQIRKWCELLHCNESDWPQIWQLPFSCSLETKLQSFQYSLLYQFVPYEKRLHAMGLVDNDLCNFCQETESIIHRFSTCPAVKQFGQLFQRWWNSLNTEDQIILNETHIILGFYNLDNYALNYCILLGKYFIHITKCQNGNVIFKNFISLLKGKIEMEKNIMTRNKKLPLFNNRWHFVGNNLHIQ